MSIFGWVIFALVNAFILFSLEYDPDKTNRLEGFVVGITGALSSSLFLYLMTQGVSKEFTLTFSLVVILESFLLMTLLFTKSFKNFN